ncbi:RidA family protein [Salmonella enterica subsp. enterica serovar Tennessee]|nr:RidA family protein [Salmonella enterica subsp. enterica serovar Tennessee]ECN9187262.1 RidA family protein [Salmonella enterica subsp. enterica serovar Tennessee]ECN9830305.1 RidA family protein [Salmonella enterica subsp. enterica serovar Tennessee]
MIIKTKNAPEAIGPYSQAVSTGNLLFISGCCPFSPEDGSVNGGDIEAQTKQAMNNLRSVVEAAGLEMDDIVKTTCFISDMNNFSLFNQVYSGYFASGTYPARSCVEVARLPKDVLIEVKAVAVVK